MHCFIEFKNDIDSISLPKLFNNPFHYTPHPLCILAAEQLQMNLPQPDLNKKGKMYGVMVVKTKEDKLGFLTAYSGNTQSNYVAFPFVPQVFEITNPEGFFIKGESQLNEINKAITSEENSLKLKALQQDLENLEKEAQTAIDNAKKEIAKAKERRQEIRQNAFKLPDQEQITDQLIKESQTEKSNFSKLKKDYKKRIEQKQNDLKYQLEYIQNLKEQRKAMSNSLQKQLFDNYIFLNGRGESKSASTIFESTALKVPPAGAGDCCAPKLLHYAYLNDLSPVAMAEFWWGNSPKKEIRKHEYFYPACKSKCEPILGHMLEGLAVEPIPKANNELCIEIVYEDEEIAVINKPAGLLSVPGKEEQASVYSQVKLLYPNADEPLIVHRLDMATSGILLIAKTKEAHKHLQMQFLNKKVQKRYVAILDGIITEDSGSIDLPLRVDLNDRPRQLVCFEYGKPAITKWKVVERTDKQTRVCFFPISGRTHQLRVHAAHAKGLDTPIVGDELYGTKSDRLKLHAEK